MFDDKHALHVLRCTPGFIVKEIKSIVGLVARHLLRDFRSAFLPSLGNIAVN